MFQKEGNTRAVVQSPRAQDFREVRLIRMNFTAVAGEGSADGRQGL